MITRAVLIQLAAGLPFVAAAAQPVAAGAAQPVAGGAPPVAVIALPPTVPASVLAPAPASEVAPAPPGAPAATATATKASRFAEDDVLGAAEALFGKGAEGLADIVRKTFDAYGQPNAYITGREAGGAFIVGLRYGSGTLNHRIEGEQPVHWTGPSIGFDVGGDGSKVFALVYDLNDTAELFRRYPAAEGKAYLVGGFTAEYLQRDDVIIVPIKLGIGVRLGINAGYMHFTRQSRINPF